MRRTFTPPLPVDLRLTLGLMKHGRFDPTMELTTSSAVLTMRTPEGPATLQVRLSGSQVEAEAWGPGAEIALDAAPALLGHDDEVDSFDPRHPLVGELHRRFAAMRIGRAPTVLPTLLAAIICQRVTGMEAMQGWRRLVRLHGEEAPGSHGLLLPPEPRRLAALPYHALHPLGIERRRAETIKRACHHAGRIEEAATMALPDARRRLAAVPGVGPWTVAEVAIGALGDPDAVSVGDYNIPHLVSWALAGEPRGTDDRMLELLEPWRGHRGRVIRLLHYADLYPTRRAPKAALSNIARL